MMPRGSYFKQDYIQAAISMTNSVCEFKIFTTTTIFFMNVTQQTEKKCSKKFSYHLCPFPDSSSNRASRNSPLSLYVTVILLPEECLNVNSLFFTCEYSILIACPPFWIFIKCFSRVLNVNTVEMLVSYK